MASSSRQISIGFQASMPIAMRVKQEQLDALLGALGGEGWHEVEAEDSQVSVNLGQVVYVRLDTEQHRVGF